VKNWEHAAQMSIVWEQRIRHIDRPVNRVVHRRLLRSLDRQALKAAVKAQRGAPSGNHSSHYVVTMARLAIRRATRRENDSVADANRLLWLRLRERMLEKKRTARHAAARRRRPRVTDTGINQARRNREYLRENA
jgi:hypothetical protein